MSQAEIPGEYAGDAFRPLVELGVPHSNRRLSDKLLAAFNHAYAIGEADMATRLRSLLLEIETAWPRPAGPAERRRTGAVEQADLWVDFVDARERYLRACDDGWDQGRRDAARARMTEAHRRWARS